MEKLVISKIDNDEYTLVNLKNKKEYTFYLKFYTLEDKIKVGTMVAFHKELLDPDYEEYSVEYYFGPLDEKYGRVINKKEDIDVIAVKVDDKVITLKRFFG